LLVPLVFSLCLGVMSVFFFSSRRRHTRFSRDWSSDVCSSHLQVAVGFAIAWWRFPGGLAGGLLPWDGAWALPGVLATARDEVLTGVVPVAVGAPLDFLLVCATALLAVVVDQLAVAARLPLVATL